MNAIRSLTDPQHQALLETLKKICDVFWGPDIKRCEEMLSPNYFESHNQLRSLLPLDPPDTLDKLAVFINSFQNSKAFFDTLEETYVRLFISSKKLIRCTNIQSPPKIRLGHLKTGILILFRV